MRWTRLAAVVSAAGLFAGLATAASPVQAYPDVLWWGLGDLFGVGEADQAESSGGWGEGWGGTPSGAGYWGGDYGLLPYACSWGQCPYAWGAAGYPYSDDGPYGPGYDWSAFGSAWADGEAYNDGALWRG